jgi:hypothetical protein
VPFKGDLLMVLSLLEIVVAEPGGAVRLARQMNLYVHLLGQRKSGACREPRDLREDRHEALPYLLRQQRPHPGLRPLPRGTGFRQLRGSGRSDRDQLLAAVIARLDGDPTRHHQRAKVAGQRCLVEVAEAAQVALPNLPDSCKDAEQRILGRAQTDAAQLRILVPADGPRRLTQGVAKAGGGSPLVMLCAHVACIYK